MKYSKNIIKVMLLVCLAIGQSVATAQITALSKGDKCPDVLVSHLKKITGQQGKPMLKPKAILIDFWATYCLPCLVKMPNLDSIQKENSNDLSIISVTQQKNKKQVFDVWNKVSQNKSLTLIIADTILNKYFPHSGIPHYVLISSDGIVEAITEHVDRSNVARLINRKPIDTKDEVQKIKVKFGEPLYAGRQITLGNELMYHSMITKFRPDVQTFDGRGDDYINVQNNSILHLYQIAFGKFNLDFLDKNRVILKGFNSSIDSANFGFAIADKKYRWNMNKEKNAFSYELFLPGNSSSYLLFKYMQQDLNRYFESRGIIGRLEKAKIRVLSLIKLTGNNYTSFIGDTTSSEEAFSSANSVKIVNMPVSFFIAKVQPYINKINLPVVNDTGYEGLVSIEINDIINIESINKDLEKYGLRFKEIEKLIDIILIKKL